MSELKIFDKAYKNSLNTTYNQLVKTYSDILENYNFDLTKNEISDAILDRIKCYYLTQNDIKIFLNKRYQAAGADYFVETVLFYLQVYLQSKGGELQAHSEKQLQKKKNSIRPDISIWRKDELVAIIECKTQLGWNRHNWEQQHIDRELKLKSDFPNAKAFLLVMTGLNWGGFENNEKLGKQFFCLLDKTWITDYSSTEQILTPIERLFEQL